jgi:hypothetical protein
VVEIAKLNVEIVNLRLVVLRAEVRGRPRDITRISLLYRELAWWAALLIVGREHLRPGRPVGEEYVKKAARHRAEARLARVVPYDFDNEEKLDPMALLEEAIRHFYWKAKIEESLGRFCDFRIVDNAIQNAARIAREIVSFRHPKISAVKLAVADPNAELLRGDMTADEMREIIRRKLEQEGLLPPRQVEHQGLVREVDEQRRRCR